jgi:hypothetical protein
VIPPWVWIYSPIEGLSNTLIEELLERWLTGSLRRYGSWRKTGTRGPGRDPRQPLRCGQRHRAENLLGPRWPTRVLDELPRHLRRDEERVPERLRRRCGPRRSGVEYLGEANGKNVSYDSVSFLEIEEGKVSRFRAYFFDPRSLSTQVVD